jgi:hypothetical protein
MYYYSDSEWIALLLRRMPIPINIMGQLKLVRHEDRKGEGGEDKGELD